MAVDIFLITDPETDLERTAALLKATLERVNAAAVLIAAGEADDYAYVERAKALAPIAQAHDCAAILDGRPSLVKSARADGVHMSGGITALREAIETLKPDYIVGTGDIGSRHEAMVRGELDIDYLMFGDRDAPELDGREMADWWAETFEVPSVYFASQADAGTLWERASEFVAFAQADWENIEKLLGDGA